MKAQTKRDGSVRDMAYLVIHIGEDKYRLTESVDGKLTINKSSLDNQEISVYPRYTNQIDIK